MIIHINPDSQSLRGFLQKVAQGDYVADMIYTDKRNVVARVRMGDSVVVVKKFPKAGLLKGIVYRWFRKPKAERAYMNAQQLLNSGFETARPIAYVVLRHHGLYAGGYYVSEYLPYKRMDDLYQSMTNAEDRRMLWHDFVELVAAMHAKGIYQQDNNAGNYLVRREGLQYRFALVDINRLEFNHTPNQIEAMRVFEHQNLSIRELLYPITLYDAKRGFDDDMSVWCLLDYRRRMDWWRDFKRRLKGKKTMTRDKWKIRS